MAFKTVIYSSSQAGMPATTLTTAGGLLAVLDACLVDGINSRAATGITRSGSTATLAYTGTDNFAIGEVIESAGWDQAEYNGRFKITAKTSSSVSFSVGGTPTSPGTSSGGATMKHPAAGWVKSTLGTNIRAYQTVGGLGHYMQVEDNNPYADSNVSVRTRLAESLTSLDTATSLGDQRKVQKVAGTWVLIADPKTCYLIMNAANVFHFGEFASFNASDLYYSFQTRGETGEAAGSPIRTNGRIFPAAFYTPGMNTIAGAPGITVLRGNSQLSGYVNGHCMETCDVVGYSSAINPSKYQYITSPNAADNSIPLLPMFVVEYSAANVLRGQFRGMWWPMCQLDPAQFTGNVARLDDIVIGGTLRSVAMVRFGVSSAHQIAFDLGDWA